jgi:hypothetical protein
MAYAVLSDITNKWRPLPAVADQNRATVLLEEAEALLDQKLPDLAGNITAGLVSPVLARKVVTDAVIRVLANPAGVAQQTVGPESVQFTGVRTLGTVEFTASELASLAPAGDGVSAQGVAVGSATFGFPWVSIDTQVV